MRRASPAAYQAHNNKHKTLKRPSFLLGHSALLASNVMWGLMAPLGKDLLNGGVLPPMSLAAVRIIAAAALFWTFSLIMPERAVSREPVKRGDWTKLCLASLLVIAANQVLIILGLSMASPVDGAIICSSTPILCVLVTAVVLRRWVGWAKAAGVAVGFAGMLLFALGGNADTSRHIANPLLGDTLCVAAQLCGALYLVLFTDILERYTPFTLMKWLFTISAVVMAPFTVGDIASLAWGELTTPMWAELLYVVVCATFLAYLLLPVGQKRVAPTTVAMYNYLQPVVAVVFSVAAGLAVLSPTTLLATLLIIGGVIVVNK